MILGNSGACKTGTGNNVTLMSNFPKLKPQTLQPKPPTLEPQISTPNPNPYPLLTPEPQVQTQSPCLKPPNPHPERL